VLWDKFWERMKGKNNKVIRMKIHCSSRVDWFILAFVRRASTTAVPYFRHLLLLFRSALLGQFCETLKRKRLSA
jgi:hypothetical protein